MINDFRGIYRWLSNFHLVPIRYQGIDFPSTEHAYQAMKSFDHNVRLQFSTAAGLTCKEAKKLGGQIALRTDWDKIRLQVMEDITRLKFAVGSDLAYALVNTGNEELCEGNKWCDNVWGICSCSKCPGIGQNLLGKTLMKIRGELPNVWLG
jgi:hypothetical protein